MTKQDFFEMFRKCGLHIYVFFFVALSYWEALVGGFTSSGSIHPYSVLFNVSWAAFFTLLSTVFTKKPSRAVVWIISAVCFLIYGSQLVYHHIFDTFFSIAQIGMGADAIKSFGTETLIGIGECAVPIILLTLPLVALAFFGRSGKHAYSTEKKRALISNAAVCAISFGLALLVLLIGGNKSYSANDIYHNTFVLNLSHRNFGALTTMRLEFRNMFFPSNGEEIDLDPIIPEDPVDPDSDDGGEDADGDPEKTDDPEPVVIQYGYNNMDIDFKSLIENETDGDILKLHKYFASRVGTKQNEYTGMFKDYNLIVLCCESFSQYMVDKDLMPALYKMSTEGFIFSDYYNTVCDNTSNGEYSLNLSLLPDASLLKRGWTSFYNYNSFTISRNNLLPFALGNQFKKLGAKAWGVHYYHGNYYGRNKTHPNLGYDFKYAGNGLDSKVSWPTSDLQMMEQTLPELLTPNEEGEIERFCAYYMTFSGHMYYNFSTNAMAKKNKAAVADLPYSGAVKAYLACNLELEYAIEYMMEQLENAGVADKTLIVLTADHYPYNLTLDKLSELAGHELSSSFDKYKGGLYIWSASMTEPVVRDVPCCTLDILPTVSNLLGLEFDSRMMMGTDIMSNGLHIAILADRSFVTEEVMYDCTEAKVTYRTDDRPADKYIENLISVVKNKFSVSNEMLYNDYYRKVFR